MNRSRISAGSVNASGVFASGHAAIMCALSYAKRAELGQLAPGVLTRHTRQIGTPAQRRELVKWIYFAGVMGALVLVLGLSAGVLA